MKTTTESSSETKGSRKVATLPWVPSILAGILFIAASACFVESIVGLVNLAQPLMSVLISFVITGTFCWEWKVFGNPGKIARFIAHLLLGTSLFFMINALFAENPQKDDLLGNVLGLAEKAVSFIASTPIITSFFDVLSSPGIAVLFLITCLAFSIPRRDAAVGLFAAAAIVVVVFGMMGDAMAKPGFFLLGMILLALGCWVLYEDRERAIFWERVGQRLGDDPALRGDTELKIRLLKQFLVTRTPESSRACCGLISRTLGVDPDEPDAKQVTLRVVRQMIEQDRVAVLTYPDGIAALAPHPDLSNTNNSDIWSAVGRSIKLLVVALIALIWVLSPVDLIPDQIPLLGVIDDVLVALLGAGAIRQGFVGWRKSQGVLTHLD
ncbi:YkvA family protein [Haloferula sp.]|uniref:YkvA family protein n=1 Tax=Haloferula sp. TaxID=2497595 RepID=UPI00329D4889